MAAKSKVVKETDPEEIVKQIVKASLKYSYIPDDITTDKLTEIVEKFVQVYMTAILPETKNAPQDIEAIALAAVTQAIRSELVQGRFSADDWKKVCPRCNLSQVREVLYLFEKLELENVEGYRKFDRTDRTAEEKKEETEEELEKKLESTVPPLTNVDTVEDAIARVVAELEAEKKVRSDPTPKSICGYEIKGFLGAGTYGQVYLALHPLSKKKIAIKVQSLRSTEDRGIGQENLTELAIANFVHHRNVLSVDQISLTCEQSESKETKIVMVMELASGDLATALNNELFTRFNISDVGIREYRFRIAHDIGCGLRYLHQLFLFLDLKPNNILIMPDGTVKITDFGLSQHKDSAHWNRPSNTTNTLWWRAPSLLCGLRQYGTPSDVWAYGIVLIEIFFGHLLWVQSSVKEQIMAILQSIDPSDVQLEEFKNATLYQQEWATWCQVVAEHQIKLARAVKSLELQLPQYARKHYRQEYYGPKLYKLIWNLITSCLTADPARRPTMDEIMRHPLWTEVASILIPCSTEGPPPETAGRTGTEMFEKEAKNVFVSVPRDETKNKVIKTAKLLVSHVMTLPSPVKDKYPMDEKTVDGQMWRWACLNIATKMFYVEPALLALYNARIINRSNLLAAIQFENSILTDLNLRLWQLLYPASTPIRSRPKYTKPSPKSASMRITRSLSSRSIRIK